jgi:predicted nucleic acid-binding protein
MIVREAARGVAAHRFHFWDAQLWATARLNQIEVLLSEDLSDGSMVGGVRFLNPFGTAFQIEDWI